MSKRYSAPQNCNESKKPKLDLPTVNTFSLNDSKNSTKDVESDPWGDENDDELLLLASQVCDPALSNSHTLPDYSICMKPTSTSTQIEISTPGTSKNLFKVPSISIHTKNINRISSPLHGLIKNVSKTIQMPSNNTFNDKVCKSLDSDEMYRQLLRYQEENCKLKSELGTMYEKCATKEGEVSILRTQLKSCQVNLDVARIEKVKAQEKVQVEYSEKLESAKKTIKDLKTELDFKSLEIINMKEKCKVLDSPKVNLTQVLINNNDISSRPNRTRVVNVDSQAIQTDNRMHFLKLVKSQRSEKSTIQTVLPLLLEATCEQYPLLEYNEKLAQVNLSKSCRTFGNFRSVATHAVMKAKVDEAVYMKCIKEDLISLAIPDNVVDAYDKYVKVLSLVKRSLEDIQSQLKSISRRVTTSFLREMNEKFIEATDRIYQVQFLDLFGGRILYKEEQGVLARRTVAVLCCLMRCHDSHFDFYSQDGCHNILVEILDLILNICSLLDDMACAILYSGLIMSILNLFTAWKKQYFTTHRVKFKEIVKTIIFSRPLSFVFVDIFRVLRRLSLMDGSLEGYCSEGNTSNLKLDYEKGVLVYKKDSCTLQVLLRQAEVVIECIFKQKLTRELLEITRHLIALNSNIHLLHTNKDQNRCECGIIFLQVIVYSFMLNAEILKDVKLLNDDISKQDTRDLEAICRCGIRILYRFIDSIPRLSHYEGYMLEFCNAAKEITLNEIYSAMLNEIMSQYQTVNEDLPISYHKEAWIQSFQDFTLSD